MTNHDPRRLAYAYLSNVVLGPSAPLSRLVQSVGVEEAARAVRDWDLPPALRSTTQARRHLEAAAEHLDTVERLGGRLVTPDDAEWPAWRLTALGAAHDERDYVAPLALWVRGQGRLTDLTDRSIAVVGTRAPSNYGESVTDDIAGELATRGWTIVSGAAFGIDAAAHRAALSVASPTIAVLAGGIDKPYPVAHTRLLERIASTGLVVSEYPPGVTVARYRFLTRNRLVAALADAVVVVEAGWRSGARNTAKWARRLGRPALAVPGSVNSASSTGCHTMIREGEARLVTRAAEVIEDAGPLRLPIERENSGDGILDSLSGDRLLVYEALPTRGACTSRELSEASGVPLDSVRTALAVLDVDGYVTADDEGWRRVAR